MRTINDDISMRTVKDDISMRNILEWKVLNNDKKIQYSLLRSFRIIFLLHVTTKASVIRDSSDSNPNNFDLMLGDESRSALYIENLLPASTPLSLTFYIISVKTLSVVGSIFILPVSLTLSAVNTRLHLLSQRNIHQFEFPFESLCTWLQHICTQHLKPSCGCWLTTVLLAGTCM